MDALTGQDMEYLSADRSFIEDVRSALRFADYDFIRKTLPGFDLGALDRFNPQPDPEYAKLARRIRLAMQVDTSDIENLMAESGLMRNFLG